MESNKVLLLSMVLLLSSETNAIFTCRTTGRFPDLTDVTCKKYFHCRMTIIGTLRAMPYRCGGNSYFDSETQKCSTTSSCNKISTPLDHVTFFLHPFTCVSSGFFPDPNDQKCQHYFRCIKLFNVLLYKLPYYCQNSFFDPILQQCTKDYKCQKNVINIPSSTTEASLQITPESSSPTLDDILLEITSAELYETTSFEEMINFKVFKEIDGQNVVHLKMTPFELNITSSLENVATTNTMNVTISEVTMQNVTFFYDPKDVSSSTENQVSINQTSSLLFPDGDFICSTAGKFPDLGDITCSGYFLCSNLRNGTILKTTYKCPDSNFDPVLKRCSIQYECTLEKLATSLSAMDILTSTEILSTNAQMMIGLELKDIKQIQTMFSDVVPVTSAAENFSHSESDPTSIQQSTVILPTNELDMKEITQMKTEVVTVTSDVLPATNDIGYFACSEKGKFPDLNDQTCRRYYHCTKLKNGTFIQTVYTCPNSSFDPVLKICSKYYGCSHFESSVSITPTVSKHGDLKTQNVENYVDQSGLLIYDFRCSQPGRFPDLEDATCSRYFLCSTFRNGTILKTVYHCPNSSFDPLTQMCSDLYECQLGKMPIDILTSTGMMSTDDPKVITSDMKEMTQIKTIPQFESTTPTIPTVFKHGEYQIQTMENLVDQSNILSYDFRCFQPGRFSDARDVSCKWYFLCNLLRNGTFIKTPYECPSSSVFDPFAQLCSLRSTCSYKTSII